MPRPLDSLGGVERSPNEKEINLLYETYSRALFLVTAVHSVHAVGPEEVERLATDLGVEVRQLTILAAKGLGLTELDWESKFDQLRTKSPRK